MPKPEAAPAPAPAGPRFETLWAAVVYTWRWLGGQGHTVRYRKPDGTEEEWDCDAVAVCSGLHVTPAIPDIPGIERVPVVIHSSQYKSRKDFGEGKNVVIMGVGETGMDIGLFAVESPTKRVIMCHQNGWVNAPKVSFKVFRCPPIVATC